MQPAPKPSNKKALRWLFKRADSARFWIIAAVGLGLSSGLLLIAQARFLSLLVHAAFMQRRPVEQLWPFFAVLALSLTALLTLAFFLFNGPVIELESQVVKGLSK